MRHSSQGSSGGVLAFKINLISARCCKACTSANTVLRDLLHQRIFMLAINITALAAGYLMRGMGLQWFIPVIFLIAWAAVLVSRRWVKAEDSLTRRARCGA
jgi:hypothetical protein